MVVDHISIVKTVAQN